MATIILALLIFGFSAFVVVSKLRSKGDCGDCHTDCPIKTEEE